jgi:hypothetical protein
MITATKTMPKIQKTAFAEGRQGDTIPPSAKLGRRRLFLRKAVHNWINDLPYSQVANDNYPTKIQNGAKQ